MTEPTTPPAVSEAMREAVAPSAGALKVAQNEGGAAGVLAERIAWALDPEAFQIWERDHEQKPRGSGPTWDQLAVHGRRARARATAAELVAGPIASELAEAEARGRRLGLEEAAKVCDERTDEWAGGTHGPARRIAKTIRSLATAPAETRGK